MSLETYTRESLKGLRFRPNRLRGQNFLVDESAQEALAKRANLAHADTVVEVGAGLGTLTRRLARESGRVFTFEIEDFFFGFLDKELKGFPNVTLIKKSFNAYSLGELLEEIEPTLNGGRIKVCANLPYQISSLFLKAMVEYAEWISLVCVMLQREVAERVTASPGSRTYGSLSVFLQTYFAVERVLGVPPDAFIPQPEVESAIIAMAPRSENSSELPESELYFKLTSGIFKHRRKTAANALKRTFPHLSDAQIEAAFGRAGVSSAERPENLSRENLSAISSALAADAPVKKRGKSDIKKRED